MRLCSVLFSCENNLTTHTHTLMANEAYDTAVCQRRGRNPPGDPATSSSKALSTPAGPAVQSTGQWPGDWAVACRTEATRPHQTQGGPRASTLSSSGPGVPGRSLPAPSTRKMPQAQSQRQMWSMTLKAHLGGILALAPGHGDTAGQSFCWWRGRALPRCVKRH